METSVIASIIKIKLKIKSREEKVLISSQKPPFTSHSSNLVMSFPRPLEKVLTDFLGFFFFEPRDKENVISMCGLKELGPTSRVGGIVPLSCLV